VFTNTLEGASPVVSLPDFRAGSAILWGMPEAISSAATAGHRRLMKFVAGDGKCLFFLPLTRFRPNGSPVPSHLPRLLSHTGPIFNYLRAYGIDQLLVPTLTE
jgi:hypothetical protein